MDNLTAIEQINTISTDLRHKANYLRSVLHSFQLSMSNFEWDSASAMKFRSDLRVFQNQLMQSADKMDEISSKCGSLRDEIPVLPA